MAQFRPKKTGNQATDEGFRQAFDYIYALATRLGGSTTTSASGSGSVAPAAVSFSGGGGGGGGGSSSGKYVVVVPSGGAAVIDLSNGDWSTFEVGLGATSTKISNPTNSVANYHFVLVLRQDSTGGRLMTWDSGYSGVGDQVWSSSVPSDTWKGIFVVRPDGKVMLCSVPFAGEAY